jgi:hypothetical protein
MGQLLIIYHLFVKVQEESDDMKSFNGKKYTGMPVGLYHHWNYPNGEWEETKVEPDVWKIKFNSLNHSAVACLLKGPLVLPRIIRSMYSPALNPSMSFLVTFWFTHSQNSNSSLIFKSAAVLPYSNELTFMEGSFSLRSNTSLILSMVPRYFCQITLGFPPILRISLR